MMLFTTLVCLIGAVSVTGQQQPTVRGGGVGGNGNGNGATTATPNVHLRSLQDDDSGPILTDPSCNGAPILIESNETSTVELILTDDISCGDGTALTITQNNTILNCQGYTVRRNETFQTSEGIYDPSSSPGSGGGGFFVTGAAVSIEADNVTLTNCDIFGFIDGIVMDRYITGPTTIQNVTATANTANGIKTFGTVSIENSIFTGNGRTGLSVMGGSADITSSAMNSNGGSGAFVNDGASAGFFNVQLNDNGMPQVWGQGVGLVVAPFSKTTVFQTEVCGNKDGAFRVLVPREGESSGVIQVEVTTCDDSVNCEFECDPTAFSR
ncbi:MAG: hypothetical protein SGARI_001320, partial [Bacillariaceae sp.]